MAYPDWVNQVGEGRSNKMTGAAPWELRLYLSLRLWMMVNGCPVTCVPVVGGATSGQSRQEDGPLF